MRGSRIQEEHLAMVNEKSLKNVFIYRDNSNLFIEAQNIADEMNHDFNARYRVRLHFENLLLLAHANRPVEKAYAVGAIPPEMDRVWTRL